MKKLIILVLSTIIFSITFSSGTAVNVNAESYKEKYEKELIEKNKIIQEKKLIEEKIKEMQEVKDYGVLYNVDQYYNNAWSKLEWMVGIFISVFIFLSSSLGISKYIEQKKINKIEKELEKKNKEIDSLIKKQENTENRLIEFSNKIEDERKKIEIEWKIIMNQLQADTAQANNDYKTPISYYVLNIEIFKNNIEIAGIDMLMLKLNNFLLMYQLKKIQDEKLITAFIKEEEIEKIKDKLEEIKEIGKTEIFFDQYKKIIETLNEIENEL